ncbi:hypothetical protein PG989_007220 [Apiospora arundinis]
MTSSQPSFSRFPDLPEELITNILDFLEPEDKAALGLTNHSMAARLTVTRSGANVHPWVKLRGNVLFRFLCAIEKDCDPHVIACRGCLRLHLADKCSPSHNSPRYRGHRRNLPLPKDRPHPNHSQDLATSLYILAKYKRHGLNLDHFFPTLLTGQEIEEGIGHYTTLKYGPKWAVKSTSRLAYNEHGLFWQQRSEHRLDKSIERSLYHSQELDRLAPFRPKPKFFRIPYPDHACVCGELVSHFDMQTIRQFVNGWPLPNTTAPLSSEDAQDMTIPEAESQQKMGFVGPISGCHKCRRDFHAEMTYSTTFQARVLTLTFWAFLGDGGSHASIQAALLKPWENTEPLGVGRVAELSGLP